MYYIFDSEGKCVASCNYKPDDFDLSNRGEYAIKSNEYYDISKIKADTDSKTKDISIVEITE